VKQLSAELLGAWQCGQLVDANVDQPLQPLAFILAPLLVSAGVGQQLLEAVADVGHATSTVAPGQRFWAYLIACFFDSARVIHVIGLAPTG
jgi:hypothetical protein